MKEIIEHFHKLFYDRRIFKKCYWMGTPIWKNPLDLWIYQEIIYNHKPEVIIETGSYKGASAHFMASIINLIGYKGEVYSIDIIRKSFPKLDNLTFITADSIDLDIYESMVSKSSGKSTMVVLDSDHTKDHVLKELELYSKLVTPGHYLIVEDTNLNGHPVITKGFNGQRPGPMEAIEEFLKTNNNFQVDEGCEKFLLTMHPKGFLKKNA